MALTLEKFSIGVGDRFEHEAEPQLKAISEAENDLEITIAAVWNKSNREHDIIGTEPSAVRLAADAAVKQAGWQGAYHVDADHINIDTVDRFIDSSDFFTLDVADYIGKKAKQSSIDAFVEKYAYLTKKPIEIDGMEKPVEISEAGIREIANKYLFAVQKAGEIYKRIESAKGAGNFITEVSMDETPTPQTPVEMLFILAAIKDENIPVQTIAPKFTGRFNKGVDYVGDVNQFEKEFREDLAVIKYAVGEFGLPDNLKLSVHSGSDKVSIYGIMKDALTDFDAGIHLKTAGTTWLEEIIGLAEAGGEGLVLAKEIYAKAYDKFDLLCAPYAQVIAIKKDELPTPEEVDGWDRTRFANTVRHDKMHGQENSDYNPEFRQLLHVAYKIAADMGKRYLDALEKPEHQEVIAKNVTKNIYNHIMMVMPGNN